MNDLIIFENPEFGKMRTLTIDEEPWAVGKDVALMLGYKNPQEAIRNHVAPEDKGVSEILTPGGKQKLPIINESGLYSLILSSKLPGAKRFKHWVTSEVLPAIRKHGAYRMPETVEVFGNKIQIREWEGQRVITFQDIDTIHQLPRGTASRNFRENRDRFIEDVDYFKTSANEQRRSGINGMTLLTESGYITLTDFFHNDFVSEVRQALAEQYFMSKPQEEAAPVETETEINVSVANHSTLIQCASIMATCMEINRPNVLNILRHIVPDIDRMEPVTVQTESVTVEVPAVPEETSIITSRTVKKGFDYDRLARLLKERKLTDSEVGRRMGLSSHAVYNWRKGVHPPNGYNLIKLCDALGVASTYFDK